jgi:hypothetical protein
MLLRSMIRIATAGLGVGRVCGRGSRQRRSSCDRLLQLTPAPLKKFGPALKGA